MISVKQAEDVLKKMLTESGYDIKHLKPDEAVEVFKKFCLVEVDCAEDDLLSQCGAYDWHNSIEGKRYELELVRQFSIDIDGEYDHMEQLRLTIYYEPIKELKRIKQDKWKGYKESLDDYFAQVKKMKGYKIPLEKYKPIRSSISQERV